MCSLKGLQSYQYMSNRDINRKAGLAVCASFIWQKNTKGAEEKKSFSLPQA